MLSSEVSVDPTTIEPEEEGGEPASELSGEATQEMEESPEGEKTMLGKEEGIARTTPSDEGKVEKTMASLGKQGRGARDENVIGAAAGEEPGVPPSDREGQRTQLETVKEKILCK